MWCIIVVDIVVCVVIDFILDLHHRDQPNKEMIGAHNCLFPEPTSSSSPH